MEKKQNNIEITGNEFPDLLSSLINSHEKMRKYTAEQVENTVALDLVVMACNIQKHIKEAQSMGQNTENYESYLTTISAVLDSIRVIYRGLYPSHFGLGLEANIRGFSKEHSDETAIPFILKTNCRRINWIHFRWLRS